MTVARGIAGRLRTVIVLALVNLLLLIGLLELTGTGLFYSKFGGLIYGARDSGSFVAGVAPIKVLDTVFHPYAGYSIRRSLKNPKFPEENFYYVNNEGFGITWNYYRKQGENCCDIPVRPGDNQYLVAIHGGSLARNYARYVRQSGYLAKRLAALPAAAGKEIIIVNLALSGYRQPQQLMIQSYMQSLGQSFDLVINIDGYNEVYHGWLNHEQGVDIAFPAADIWGAMHYYLERLNMEVDDDQGIKSIYHLWRSQGHNRQAVQCRFGLCYLYHFTLGHYFATGKYSNDLSKFSKVAGNTTHFLRLASSPKGYLPSATAGAFAAEQVLYKAIAGIWGRSHAQMANIVSRTGGRYIGILQPNLYFSRGRKFEAANPSAWLKNFSRPVEIGYPFLVQEAERLSKAGLPVIDGTMALEDAPQAARYTDDCCHINDTARKHLTDFIVDKISDRAGPK